MTKNYKDFSIDAYSWETRNAWGHKAILYYKGHKINEHKITYYNRTWESYEYQSVMLGVISNELQYLLDSEIDEYKERHNIKRLSQAKKDEIANNMDNDLYRDLHEFYNTL